MNINEIRVIAFDADDTLWDCQSHFEEVENLLYAFISPYCDNPAAELYQTESNNMEDLGYGCKAFTISVMETALRVCGNDLTSSQLSELLEAGKHLLHLPATPLPGVVETLRFFSGECRVESVEFATALEQGKTSANPTAAANSKLYTLNSKLSPTAAANSKLYTLNSKLRIVCFTKGELQDQENKLKRSGLAKYFDHVEITSDKSEKEFRELCEHLHIAPHELLMVGNSLKSDIAPALAIGAQAVHIPFHVTWQLEHHEDFEHPRMVKLESISQLPDLLLHT